MTKEIPEPRRTMVNRIITRLFSAKTRASSLERTIDRLSANASARYARGNTTGQDGHILSESDIETRRERIRARLAKARA